VGFHINRGFNLALTCLEKTVSKELRGWSGGRCSGGDQRDAGAYPRKRFVAAPEQTQKSPAEAGTGELSDGFFATNLRARAGHSFSKKRQDANRGQKTKGFAKQGVKMIKKGNGQKINNVPIRGERRVIPKRLAKN